MSSATTVIATQAPREQWLSKVQDFAAVPTGSTATIDYSQPVVAVESVNTAERHLLSYLALANPLYDLRLRIPTAILFSKPVEKILRSILRQKRRFAYDRETSVLRLYAMARPVHDAVLPLVSNFLLLQAVETGFITLEERNHISCSVGGILLAGKILHTNQKKLQAWTKYPDTAILFGEPGSDQLPSVVFEVGFTESYDDLVGDAKQWLQKSRGKVRLIILVNIEEDEKIRRAKQKSSEARKRTRQLLTKFGTAKAKDREGIDYEDPDVESDEEMYDNVRCRIVVEDWVGPISATLEVWHMVNDTPTLRQLPITVLPEPPTPQHPTICITDIVPEDKRAIFEGFDESRTIELDMDRYRKLLVDGTRRLAFQRAMNYLRPRDKDDDDEHIPEDHGSLSSEG